VRSESAPSDGATKPDSQPRLRTDNDGELRREGLCSAGRGVAEREDGQPSDAQVWVNPLGHCSRATAPTSQGSCTSSAFGAETRDRTTKTPCDCFFQPRPPKTPILRLSFICQSRKRLQAPCPSSFSFLHDADGLHTALAFVPPLGPSVPRSSPLVEGALVSLTSPRPLASSSPRCDVSCAAPSVSPMPPPAPSRPSPPAAVFVFVPCRVPRRSRPRISGYQPRNHKDEATRLLEPGTGPQAH